MCPRNLSQRDRDVLTWERRDLVDEDFRLADADRLDEHGIVPRGLAQHHHLVRVLPKDTPSFTQTELMHGCVETSRTHHATSSPQ